MSDPSVLCFPKLVEDRAGLASNPQVGEWSGQFGSLGTLAGALDNGETISLDDVKSVPTIWGRVASFEDALFDTKHVAHESAVSSWRALLCLMALRNDPIFKQLNLEIKNLDMRNVVPGSFRDMAAKVRPKKSLDGPAGWDVVRLIQLHDGRDNHLIGLMSPNTLLAPARSASLGAIPVPWIEDGLKDPLTERTWLTSDQKALLAFMLDEVIRGLKAVFVSGSNRAGRMLELLEDYRKAVEASGSAKAVARPVGVDDLNVITQPESILCVLNRAYSLQESTEMITDCEIVPSTSSALRLKAGDSKRKVTFLLADQSLATTQGEHPSEVSLYGSVRLTEDQNIKALKDRIMTDDRAVMVFEENDLFADHLTPLTDYSIKAHGAELGGFLLPFKPAIFLILGEEQLLNRVKISQASGGYYSVSLTLDVKNRQGNSYQHTMIRRYRLSPDPITHDSEPRVVSHGSDIHNAPFGPDALAAWPNFKTDDWPHNYLFAVTNPTTSPTLSSGISSELVIEDLSRLDSLEAVYRRLDLWCGSDRLWSEEDELLKQFEVEDPEKGELLSRQQVIIQRAKRPFQGASFNVGLKNAGFKSANSIYAGLALLPPAQQADPSDQKGRVSIDFGTTNTTIYIKMQDRKPVFFQPRLRRLKDDDLSAQGSGVRDIDPEIDRYRKFMPPVEVEQPFATIAEIRSLIVDPDARAKLNTLTQEPLIKDFAYFDTEVKNIVKAILGNPHRQGVLKFDLKWSKIHTDVEMVERYIAHLAMLSLAELAATGISIGEVKWAFSYPMSRSSGGENYRSIVKRVLKRLTQSYGQEESSEPDVYFVTESDAALKDFQHRFPDYQNSRVMLDIGGGTTDVGIIVDRNPIWRNSFRLAGGDLMIDFVGFNRDFFRELGLSDLFKGIDGGIDAFDKSGTVFDKNDPDNPIRQVASAVINSHQFAAAFESQYLARSNTASFEKLRAGAFLMLGGLLYYTGMQINALTEDGQIDRELNPMSDVEICLAGRGSSLFKVLSDHSSVQTQRLLSMILLGAERKTKEGYIKGPRFAPKGRIKHEAAHGMIVMSNSELAMADQQRAQMEFDDLDDEPGQSRAKDWRVFGAGVDFKYQDDVQAFDKLDFLPDMIQKLGPDAIVADVDIATFAHFTESLEKLTGLTIDYSAKSNAITNYARSQMKSAIKNSFATSGRLPDMGPGESDIHSVNPPFIAMVKECLRMLYQSDGMSGGSSGDIAFFWKS